MFLCCVYHSGSQSTINIDINISEDNDISEGEGVSARDTTSTVYKAAEGNFETEDTCDNTTVSVGEDLASTKHCGNCRLCQTSGACS